MEDVVRMWEKVSIFDICTALSNKYLQNYPYQSLCFVSSQRKSRIKRFEDSQSLSGDEKARFCFRRETRVCRRGRFQGFLLPARNLPAEMDRQAQRLHGGFRFFSVFLSSHKTGS